MKPRPAPMVRLVLLSVLLGGCAPDVSDDDPRALRVACPWSKSEREAAVREFAAAAGAPIVWKNWDAPAESIDVYLGGPESVYREWAVTGRLERLDDGRHWIIARRSVVELTKAPSSRKALGDPRVDLLTRAWALGRLQKDGWSEAYSWLIDAYGRAEPVGWGAESARAAAARDAAVAVVGRLDSGAAPADGSVVVADGVAIRRGSRRTALALEFLRFFDERRKPAGEPPDRDEPLSADAESLAADLLGATLVDAQDELRKAVAEVEAAGSPSQTVSRLTTLPPWPPASVEKLLRKGGEEGATLVETLAAQLAPEPDVRLWLSRSWLRPRQPIDGAFLSELAVAEHGKLAREPRFRAWLRAEWTQWARQRYRWARALAAARSPLVTSNRSSKP